MDLKYNNVFPSMNTFAPPYIFHQSDYYMVTSLAFMCVFMGIFIYISVLY